MGLGRGKNRRRGDTAERAKAVRSLASRLFSAALRLGAAAAVLAALYFGGRYAYVWATSSPTFALKAIKVQGNERAQEGELLRLAGLAFGQNLFRLDPDAVTRAMQQHPWVARVTVTRHFPSTVTVLVQEHTPAALTALGDLYLLNADGEPFKKLEGKDVVDLPLVTGISREAYVEKPEESAESFRKALELVAQWQQLKGGPDDRVSEVRIDHEEFTVVTKAGAEVRLGQDAWDEKLQRLERVRAELRRRGVTAEVIRLDNRVRPGWVTVKVAAAGSERGGRSVQ